MEICSKHLRYIAPFLILFCMHVTLVQSQNCGTGNVRCVEPGVHYATIGGAYADCSLHSDPCVIKIKGGLYVENLHIDRFGYFDNFTPGQIMPYDGETVTWKQSDKFRPALWFTSNGNYWWVHGGNGGTIHFLSYAHEDYTVYVGAVTIGGLHLGPGLEFTTYPNYVSHKEGILVNGGGEPLDGVILEGMTFHIGPKHFDWPIRVVEFTVDSPSLLGDYRLIIRDIVIETDSYANSGIRVAGAFHFLVERVYMRIAGDADRMISVHDSAHGVIRNCILEHVVNAYEELIRVERSQDIQILHNTFVCQELPNGPGAIYLMGDYDGDSDPDNILIASNLFSGQCGSLLAEKEIIGDYACTASREVRCNRADVDALFVVGSPWIDNNDACRGGGTNLEIAFDRGAPTPIPYYTLTENHLDDFSPRIVVDDYLGVARARGAFPGSTIGALEYYVPADCNGIFADDPSVCSWNGSCTGPNPGTCDCFDNGMRYSGEWCHLPVCDGKVKGSGLECGNGNGTCVDVDLCECLDHSLYTGDWCDVPVCNNSVAGSGDECNQKGECVAGNHCVCDDDTKFTGEWCHVPVCDGFHAGSGMECHRNGTCIDYNVCDCFEDDEYSGQFCDVPFCNGFKKGSGVECNQEGTCVALDHCVCDDETKYTGKWCDVPVCEGIVRGSPLVCNYQNGSCVDYNFCDCLNDDRYVGSNCDIPVCFGDVRGSGNECNRRGECVGPDECSCPGYADIHCELPICNQISKGSPGECQNRGICQAPNECICTDPFLYTGNDCEVWKCDGISYKDLTTVCSGNGVCHSNHSCECTDPLYFGPSCNVTKCGRHDSTSPLVCSEHGSCVGPDHCVCHDYQEWNGDECEIPRCFGVDWNEEEEVCNGRGSCIRDSHICECNNSANWGGAECEVMRCNGVDWNAFDEVCNDGGIPSIGKVRIAISDGALAFRGTACRSAAERGSATRTTIACAMIRPRGLDSHGNCTDDSYCVCLDGYTGKNCEDFETPSKPGRSFFEDPEGLTMSILIGVVVVWLLLMTVGLFVACLCLCRKSRPSGQTANKEELSTVELPRRRELAEIPADGYTPQDQHYPSAPTPTSFHDPGFGFETYADSRGKDIEARWVQYESSDKSGEAGGKLELSLRQGCSRDHISDADIAHMVRAFTPPSIAQVDVEVFQLEEERVE